MKVFHRSALVLTLCMALGVMCAGHAETPLQQQRPASPSVTTPGFPPVTLLPGVKRGRHLQYSLKLLHTSNQDGFTPVRILFYGQSITEQKWSATVADYLRATYPKANLVMENRAIGGHSAQLLVKTAEADLYPFQPDLVIFHVYGSHKEYESIIRSIRQKTPADILMASDHIVLDQELSEDTSERQLLPAALDRPLQALYRITGLPPRTTSNFPDWMNFTFLPRTAEKYGAELADVRQEWKNYLVSHRFKASQLLRDNVHLNAQGEYVMAEIIKPYLNPALLDPSAAPDGRVREINADPASPRDSAQWQVEFYGSRVDAVVTSSVDTPIDILIDKQPPSAHPEIYGFSRASPYTGTNWPGLLRVEHGTTPLLQENFVATIRGADPAFKRFDFEITGSRSGAEGTGVSGQRFVSRSGRFVIDADDWNLAYARATFGRPPAADFTVTWRAVAYGIDHWRPQAPAEQILVQGLANGPHTLTLSGPDLTKVRTLKIYRPPLAE